ncbi:uncharacterized protein LOC134191175 [Corticium candelabrum]|uniref:uncharacterized protein LOC134191175 n=1 Tax=Corticium candelabrum TaxID=121492 RepID=UPI002E273F35|nr:uncharacterized protein LOC134191175 [Corticium candelabrum]XP_062515741.1 uncharacterized protein LOC134191175 [Corticium candelabrum]
MTAVTIKRILKQKEFSEKGSLSRLHEESTYMNFCRYLEDVEGGAVEETLCDLLAFFTACEMVPVMGFDPEPTLCFNEHDIFPTALTCAHQLVLPTRYHDDEQKFKAAMSTGLQFYGGYGKK